MPDDNAPTSSVEDSRASTAIMRRFELHRDEDVSGVEFRTPLIERGLTKQDCLTMIARAGIEIPAMYLLGYTNNNCIGCPKGGMGYWNKIRRDFPEVYDRMAVLERELDHSVNKDASGPVWLDEMDPDRGDYGAEPDMSCSLNCAMAEVAISNGSQGSR